MTLNLPYCFFLIFALPNYSILCYTNIHFACHLFNKCLPLLFWQCSECYKCFLSVLFSNCPREGFHCVVPNLSLHIFCIENSFKLQFLSICRFGHHWKLKMWRHHLPKSIVSSYYCSWLQCLWSNWSQNWEWSIMKFYVIPSNDSAVSSIFKILAFCLMLTKMDLSSIKNPKPTWTRNFETNQTTYWCLHM